ALLASQSCRPGFTSYCLAFRFVGHASISKIVYACKLQSRQTHCKHKKKEECLQELLSLAVWLPLCANNDPPFGTV
ncbi:TPA: hypothetical protein ACLEAQ_005898, partial [Pseudomonas aeruginosa]